MSPAPLAWRESDMVFCSLQGPRGSRGARGPTGKPGPKVLSAPVSSGVAVSAPSGDDAGSRTLTGFFLLLLAGHFGR